MRYEILYDIEIVCGDDNVFSLLLLDAFAFALALVLLFHFFIHFEWQKL